MGEMSGKWVERGEKECKRKDVWRRGGRGGGEVEEWGGR